MRKSLICALALGGFAASAQAADSTLDSLKDAVPNLTAAGVTIYGTIDVGYGYQSNTGLAYSGANYAGQMYNIYGDSLAKGSISSLTNNALSQSTIGVKIEESIGMGMTAIGKIETGFNPASGEIADACQSLVRVANALINKTTLQTFGDGSRCGQALNGEVYAGVSSPAYGTLKYGRQNSLELDAMSSYDPMGGSYALSSLGWSGFFGSGAGSTETARWNESVKYIFQYGPVHAAFAFADGGHRSTATPMLATSAPLGKASQSTPVDAVYMNERGAVNAQLGLLTGDGCQLSLGLPDEQRRIFRHGQVHLRLRQRRLQG